jgi:alkylation response protein AidB-like acyl-CoA dehydrogenase
MDLSLDEQQRALVRSFADVLARYATPERVRSAEPLGFDPELWEVFRAMGAVEMAIPESEGGWGATMLDLVLVAEQAGEAVAPVPLVEVHVATRLLASLDTSVARGILTDALEGKLLPTAAVRPASGHRASMVPGAAIADAAIILQDDRLVLVPLNQRTRRPVANLADAPLADVELAGSETVLASGDAAVSAYDRALREWFLLTASALVGLSSAAHLATCRYARERWAWDAPIGTFQAVAHPLADAAAAIDGARLLASKAAWDWQRRSPRGSELAAMAFAFAAELARTVTYDAIHFHGGYGYMLESDPQLYYRRARGWPRVWGEPRDAYRRVAAARYGREGD